MKIKTLFMAAAMVVGLAITAQAESSTDGTITISVKEYEKMKDDLEADQKNKYWNMTFEQILDKERGNSAKAWKKYEYWALRTIHLNGLVDRSSVSTLIKDIHILNQIDETKPITLTISSGGGGVYTGLELYNAMVSSKAPVNTRCVGMAASMAAVLLAAGDHRSASTACHFMLHEVSGGAPGGQTIDHVKWADRIVDVENLLLIILSENSGISMSDLRKISVYETWYDSEETLALGFVDEVVGDKPRKLAEGSRTIPTELWPAIRMKRNLLDKIGQ